MIIKNGAVYQEDKTFVKKDLYLEKGRIVENPHGQRVSGNLVDGAEKSRVTLPGLLRQRHHMGALLKYIAGLIKADMPVSADAQKLQVDPPHIPREDSSSGFR